MSVYVKQISELPIVEEINGSENIIVNDNGETKQLPINKVSPQNIKKEQLSDELLNYLATKEDAWPSELPMPSDGGFGYTGHGEQTVITWDGDTEGRVVIPAGGNSYIVKVSDKVPSYDELIDSEIIKNTGGTAIVSADNVTHTDEYLSFAVDSYFMCFVALNDNITVSGVQLPERGVYFSFFSGRYISSLTYGTPDTIHKIDEKYLPEGGIGWTEQGEQTVITWDGDTEGKVSVRDVLYKISDSTPSQTDLVGAIVTSKTTPNGYIPDTQRTISQTDIVSFDGGFVVGTDAPACICVLTAGLQYMGETFTETGLYFVCFKDEVSVPDVTLATYTSSLTYGTPDTIHKIDEKYLPEGEDYPLSHETWTFTLEDDTTVEKEVVLWDLT